MHECISFSTPFTLRGNFYINIPTQYQWITRSIVEVGDMFKDGVFLTSEQLSKSPQDCSIYYTQRYIRSHSQKLKNNSSIVLLSITKGYELDIEGYFPFIIYFYLISIFSFGQSNKKVRCDKVPLCVRPKEINCLFPVTARKKK